MPTGTFPRAGTITITTDIDPVRIRSGDRLRYTVICVGAGANFNLSRVSDGATLWRVSNASPIAPFIHEFFPKAVSGARSDRYALTLSFFDASQAGDQYDVLVEHTDGTGTITKVKEYTCSSTDRTDTNTEGFRVRF